VVAHLILPRTRGQRRAQRPLEQHHIAETHETLQLRATGQPQMSRRHQYDGRLRPGRLVGEAGQEHGKFGLLGQGFLCDERRPGPRNMLA
jgi:hypothetical protein